MSSSRRWIRAALTLLGATLLIGSACKPSTPDKPDGGGGAFSTCSQDSECRTGFRCHRELRRCVCTSDTSCPSGLYCNAFTGQCVAEVPGCTSDGQCAPSEYCEVSTRTCRKRRSFCEPCTEDVQCGSSADRCIRDEQLSRSFCGKACSTDADCDTGATCQTRGGTKTCWPSAATCESLTGCNPDSGQACQVDNDCTEGSDQVCDQVQLVCVARVPTCPFGQVCDRDTKTCTAACTTDDECSLDPECETTPCRCTNNQCVPIALCRDDSECEPGKVCVIEPGQNEGECTPACTVDADCPLGQACADPDGGGNRCFARCNSDADCSLTENCDNFRCVPGCQLNEVCGMCQICSGTGRVRSCQGAGAQYCQTCLAPDEACSGVGAGPYCCDIALGSSQVVGYQGVDCSSRACPRGFECVSIADLAGNVLAQNCFPVDTTICSATTCN